MSQSAPACNYVFTIQIAEASIADPPLELDPELVRFATYQLEAAPTTGQLHYQGYIQMFKKCRFPGVIKALGHPARLAKAKGTLMQNKDYCSKRASRVDGPWTFGEGITQGKRTDLDDACATLKEGGKQGYKRVAEEHPVAFVKYHRGFKELTRVLNPMVPMELPEPHDWQQQVIDTCKEPADDRTVVWIHDSVGGRGKSKLIKYLVTNMGACLLTGRINDMAFAYDDHPIVCFDIPRTQADNLDHIYGFAESLKNGLIFSSKYESGQKCFDPPHVIFVSNAMPNYGKWTADRYNVIDLDLI